MGEIRFWNRPVGECYKCWFFNHGTSSILTTRLYGIHLGELHWKSLKHKIHPDTIDMVALRKHLTTRQISKKRWQSIKIGWLTDLTHKTDWAKKICIAKKVCSGWHHSFKKKINVKAVISDYELGGYMMPSKCVEFWFLFRMAVLEGI